MQNTEILGVGYELSKEIHNCISEISINIIKLILIN